MRSVVTSGLQFVAYDNDTLQVFKANDLIAIKTFEFVSFTDAGSIEDFKFLSVVWGMGLLIFPFTQGTHIAKFAGRGASVLFRHSLFVNTLTKEIIKADNSPLTN